MGWLGQGEDVYALLPYLSAYMGHSDLGDTLYYVRLVPEKLSGSGRMDWDCIPEVPYYED